MDEKNDAYRWFLLTLTWTLAFAAAISFFAYPPLLPEIMLDLNMSTTEVALLMSLPTLAFTSFQLVGGLSADRFGTKRTMTLGMIIVSSSTLLSAAANSAIIEAATRFMVGVGIGLTGVCFIKVLSHWFPAKELPLAMGIQATGWATGNALGLFSPILLKPLLRMGWRGPIYMFGLIGCASTIVFIIQAREKAAQTLTRQNVKAAISSIMGVKEFWSLTIAQLGFIASNTAVITWLPTALMETDWSSETAALATTVIAIMGIPANIAGGAISNRLGKRKPLILLSGVALSFSTILLGFAIPGVLTWPAVSAVGWFSFFFTGPLLATPSALPEIGLEKVGTFIGLMMLLSSIGGTISPIIMGMLKDSTGSYTPGFLMAAGFAILLALPGILGRETGAK